MGRLDTYIGNWGGVRLLESGAGCIGDPSSASHSLGTFPPGGRLPGGPVCRPYGVRGTSMTGGSGTRPYGVFTNGSAYKKRDRFRTCPLKPRGEAKLRTKFLCLLSFSKKVRGPGLPPGPLTCVCCKGEGEMGDIDFFWVRSYHNRKIRRNRVRIMNFL